MAEFADVLLVATTKVEVDAIVEEHGALTGRLPHEVTRGQRKYFDLGIVNQASIYLGVCEMGSNGPGASQDAVRRAIETLRPTSILMVGIAYGLHPSKQEIGDVLVAEQIVPYELQRVGPAETISRSPRPATSTRLRNFCKARRSTWGQSGVSFGAMLSGEKLVDNAQFLASLLGMAPEAIGGDMEGAGLFVAAEEAKVDWIVVKAICDWADGNKANPHKTQHQRLAAKNSAAFVFDVITSTNMLIERRAEPQQRIKSDWRFVGGFAVDDPLLRRLPEDPVEALTRYEVCRAEIIGSLAGGGDEAFEKLARDTFEQHIRRRAGSERVQLQDAKSALLVAHELMARYSDYGRGVREVKNLTTRRKAVPRYFDRVYPNTVNTFVRDIFQLTQDATAVRRLNLRPREAEIAAASRYIIRTAPLKMGRSLDSAGPEVHAAYMLGRIINPAASVDAKKTLYTFEHKVSKVLKQIAIGDDDRARQHYLMRRTAMLSQSMLGDTDASKRYLVLLLDDRMESDVNAGFHLEYYGDQPLDDALPLCSRDLGEDCEKTLTYLESSLSRSLDAGWDSSARALAPIELYTFTSILARRLHSTWQPVVQRMIPTLERALEYLEDDDLRLYVNLCVELSNAAPHTAAKRIGQYFSARNAPRNGWIKRGVRFPESVGSHTAGVIWLVNLIPEVEATRLRVGRIKDLLECHDLAEGITGDIVTDRRDPEQDERERRLIRTLSWMGSYLRPEVDLYSIYSSFLEFHKRDTPEANVARDLDAIDIVLQGQSLLQSKANCDRDAIRALVNKLEKTVVTPAGKHVLLTARQMNVISSSSFGPTPESEIKEYFFGRAAALVEA